MLIFQQRPCPRLGRPPGPVFPASPPGDCLATRVCWSSCAVVVERLETSPEGKLPCAESSWALDIKQKIKSFGIQKEKRKSSIRGWFPAKKEIQRN